jgi:hypothetical protein
MNKRNIPPNKNTMSIQKDAHYDIKAKINDMLKLLIRQPKQIRTQHLYIDISKKNT